MGNGLDRSISRPLYSGYLNTERRGSPKPSVPHAESGSLVQQDDICRLPNTHYLDASFEPGRLIHPASERVPPTGALLTIGKKLGLLRCAGNDPVKSSQAAARNRWYNRAHGGGSGEDFGQHHALLGRRELQGERGDRVPPVMPCSRGTAVSPAAEPPTDAPELSRRRSAERGCPRCPAWSRRACRGRR